MGESLELAVASGSAEQSGENSRTNSPAHNRATDKDHTDSSECEPLKSGETCKNPENENKNTADIKIEMGENGKPAANGDAKAAAEPVDSDTEEKLDSAKPVTADGKPVPYKKQRKCLGVGVILLCILLCGALVAILARRFTGKSHKFEFASYYSDNMVLQRAPQRAIIWGYGPRLGNSSVSLTLTRDHDQHKIKYTAWVAYGVWRVALEPVVDHGPYSVKAELQGLQAAPVQISGVLFGDVWLCAGEDVINYPVASLQNSSEEIQEASQYKDVIRLFSVPASTTDRPWNDLMKGYESFWYKPDTGLQELKFSSLCWLYGRKLQDKLHYPVGLIAATVPESPIEHWTSEGAMPNCKHQQHHLTGGSGLWNAMIYPWLNFTISGVIWYQGKSNAAEMDSNYACTFPAMVEDWRENFFTGTHGHTDRTLPFGFVQLPALKYGEQRSYGYTELRWQQTGDYGSTPNKVLHKVFMANAHDLPEEKLAREGPGYVYDIATRLAVGSLGVAYGRKNIVFQGPVIESYAGYNNNRTLYLQFDKDIAIRSNESFEVCCSDDPNASCLASTVKNYLTPGRTWMKAPISSQYNNAVWLSWQECEGSHVVGLRYAWRESPCRLRQCAVYSKQNDLPAPPFISMGFVDDGKLHAISDKPFHLDELFQ